MGGCKSPDEALTGEPGLYLRIFRNIDIVIIVDELMFTHLPEDDYRG
jgi:hypothetical protein